jgi:surface polysaccharide O-acyltransferase-like enzyme
MRHHYIDWLRNLAILYLFPFHTARIFDSFETNYVEGTPSVVTTDLVALSYWFMPLLFLVAGMASFHALRRRSPSEYVRERVARLLVPFGFGLLVVPPQAYLAYQWHDVGGGEPWSYLGYFADWSDLSGYRGTFTPAHLWFILFLFIISVALLPVFRRWADVRLPGWARHPVGVVLPALALVALSAVPGIGDMNIVLYAGFVLAGFLIATDERITETLVRHRRAYALVAALGAVGVLIEVHTIGWQPALTPVGAAWAVGHMIVCWCTLLAFLGYGRRHLNRPSRVMRYLNGAVFPVYVVHQTYVVAIGYLVLRWTDVVWLAFAVIMLASLAASLLTYEGARRVPVLRVVLGIKAPRGVSGAEAHSAARPRRAASSWIAKKIEYGAPSGSGGRSA